MPVRAVVLMLPGALNLQQNAPAPGLGGLTGLEYRNSAFWQGSLREVRGTEGRILVNPSTSGRWKPVPGFRRRVSLRPARHVRDSRRVRGEPGHCGSWDVVVAVDQNQLKREGPYCKRSGAVFSVGGL